MADIKNGNPEKSKKKKTAAIVISLAAVCVVAAVIIILLLRSCGGEDTGYDGSSSAPVSSATEQPATGSGQEEPSEPAEPEAPSDGGAGTPTVQPENEPPAEAPERPADPVIPDKNSEASDEKTLRELLEYDGDITVTVTDDITVASPITVNGKKALKGDVTISYASDGYYGEGPFIIEMSPESELTVDGITLDGGYRASGIHIGEGANLSFADGAGRNMTFCVFYPDGGTAVVKDGVFEEVSCFDAVVESGSQMFVEGGTWEGTEYNHISVRSTGYLEVSGDALFENSHGTWAKGMLQGAAGSTIAIHDGKFDIGADCKTWQRIIDSAGTIDVSYEGDDPDGMIEMTTSTNIAICAQNGCQSLTVKGVHFYNTACGLYLNDNCRDVTVENCVFDMIEKDSTAIQVAGSRCDITLKNLTINNAYQGMKLTGDDTKLEAWDITLNKVPYVGIWVRSQTEFGQLQENELPCEIILHNYKNLNGGGWGLLAERGVSVTVEDSTFDGCKITAVEARNKTEVKLVRCDFRNNTGKNGGAVSCNGNATVEGEDCYFENNDPLSGGGIISIGNIDDVDPAKHTGGTVTLIGKDEARAVIKGSDAVGSDGKRTNAGVVRIAKGSVTIEGYKITDNTGNYGAVAFVKAGTAADDTNILKLKNCTLENNQSAMGAIHDEGNNVKIILDTVTFKGNAADDGNAGGGAIYSRVGADIQCDNCTFENNHSLTKGGAIYLGGSLHGKNNNFIGNYTSGSEKNGGTGGAVYINGGALNLTSDNKAECKFKGNHSDTDHAAAVYIENGKASITGYTFEENTIPDGKYGGLFFVKKKDGHDQNSLTISDCDINGASANFGGVIYAEDNTAVTLAGSTFTGCEAKNGGSGGAVYAHAAVVEADNCKFIGNSAAGSGGAIYMSSSAGKLSDIGSEFTGNTAAKEGGAVYSNAPAIFENTVFGGSEETGNKAGGNGGALYLAGTVTLKGTLNFTGNTTGQNGGAIYVAGGAVTGAKADCKFVKNKAHGGSSAGGAIAVHGGGSVTLARSSDDAAENCRFESNDAAAANGTDKHNASAIFIDVTGGTVNISGYTFTGHTGNNGGAITVKKKDGDVKNALTLSGCRVENTESVNGAVYAEGNTVVTLEGGTVFDSNHAANGGAIYAQDTEIKISGCIFNNNSAASGGGAIYMGHSAGKLTDNGSRFTGNHSDRNGGALLLGGQAKTADGGAGLVNTEFTGNYTTANNTSGGAVSILNGAELIGSNCLFNDNHNNGSGSEGGAICVGEKNTKNGAAKLTLTATDDEKGKFYNNSSKANGGAIYMCADNKPEVSITGYLFEGNHSDSSSGAIDVRGKLTLKGTSFISNTAGGDAGAMYIHDVEVLIEGNGPDDKALFYKNSANGGGGALVVVGANSNVTIKNADFGAGDNANKAKHQSTVWKTGGTVTATDNVDNYSEA